MRLKNPRTRVALLVAVAAVVAAIVAAAALAKTRSTPVGTGVVVIETNLAYQGGEAAGTGMVLKSSGEVLTNNHVIRGATTIRVVVPGTGRSYSAKVVGYDVGDDVAVLKASGAGNLKTVSLGDSSTVRIGQSVKAVGNAGGTGSLTSTTGMVTAIARAITVSDDQGATARLTGLIETNAALQPGDSGGPLLNSAGKVVGMDSAASVGYGFEDMGSNEGYAIPINRALTIAKQIESGKASARIHIGATAFLGVQVGASDYGEGAAIVTVVPSSPAAAAGLVPGDVVVGFDGQRIASPSALTSTMAREKPGARVSVNYLDDFGSSETTTVTLASGPPQ
jgi:S1-C subfamily serine protease